MKLIFLLAIPTFALTALAASTSSNNSASNSSNNSASNNSNNSASNNSNASAGTDTNRPPIDLNIGRRRCKEFCLGLAYQIAYKSGNCYCSSFKPLFACGVQAIGSAHWRLVFDDKPFLPVVVYHSALKLLAQLYAENSLT
ncbi:hypothetical protein BDB01DRAFT_907472 [Pilobolus umbonatus]|nr:hypothetical protein BDB01DRAFT_907472 [Pilobolus umbonatus]